MKTVTVDVGGLVSASSARGVEKQLGKLVDLTAWRSHWKTRESCGSDDPIDS